MRPTQARALARRPELVGRVSTEGGSLVIRKQRRLMERFRLKTRRRVARALIALSPMRGARG